MNSREQYDVNPQVVLPDRVSSFTDDFDPLTDDPEIEGRCSVVIALMQEHRQLAREDCNMKHLQIGFILYQVCQDLLSAVMLPRHIQIHTPLCNF